MSAKSTFLVIDMKSMCKHIPKVRDSLRFHENPSFEKITKNRCFGAYIDGFSSWGAWNFTGGLKFFIGLCKKVHARAKNQNKYFLDKNTLKSCPKNMLPFFLLPFLR